MAAVLLVSTLLSLVAADLQQTYCSPDNIGSNFGNSGLTSIYQSNGRCMNNCTAVAPGSAFAIVQGQNCWCSNYAPADQVPVSQCNSPCVGYPPESCGNADDGLFGYIQIGTPQGTQGASSSNSGSDETSSAQAQTIVNSVTVTNALTITISPSVLASSSAHTRTSKSSASTSSSASSSSTTTTPILSVQILTVSNQPVTQTVTSVPTIPPADSGSQRPVQHSSSGVSSGLIAGVVIAVVVAVLAVAGLLFFLWRRKKHQRQMQELEASTAATMVGSGSPSARPTRNTSILSKTGLVDKVYPSASAGQRSHAGSNPPEMTGGVSPISERRRSQPLFYDQRLNPTTLMSIDNGSRVSVNTMPDDRDFSRTLNVRNPDPHDSWQ